ncbi:transposase [Microbacterium sp. CJ88]|uniref:transposase n=1 Tax=Microbacterium sp. CJ88 TaxID=3445672 RepID=UPI003F656CFA
MPDGDEDAAGDEIAAVDAIAEELYVLPPAGFTAARNARATAADRAITARVKALRKPTVAAWAVNLLVREGQVAEAVELSAALREAQDDLDAAELAQLSRQRRALVAALAGQAAGLAADAGVPVSAAARDDVEKTLNAAIVDADAAAAVLTGRLVTALEAGAFDPADLPDAVGGSLPGAAAPAPRDDLAERRARKAAEKAAREAERLENESARELARIDARKEKAQERLDHLRERIDDLRGELRKFETDADAAATALAEIETDRAEAAKAAASASSAARAARSALD